MNNDKLTSTREALIHDTDALKQDAGRIVEDVKQHARAHVDAVRETVRDVVDSTFDCARQHPFYLAATAFFLGFLLGSIRRK